MLQGSIAKMVLMNVHQDDAKMNVVLFSIFSERIMM